MDYFLGYVFMLPKGETVGKILWSFGDDMRVYVSVFLCHRRDWCTVEMHVSQCQANIRNVYLNFILLGPIET